MSALLITALEGKTAARQTAPPGAQDREPATHVSGLPSLPPCLCFPHSNEEMVLTIEIPWKQQVFLSTSKVPGSVPSPGHRQEPDDVVPAVTNHRPLEATFPQGRPRKRKDRLLWEHVAIGLVYPNGGGVGSLLLLPKTDVEVETLKLLRGESRGRG